MKIFYYLYLAITTTIFMLVRIPLILLGFLVVPIALLRAKEVKGTSRVASKVPEWSWRLKKLPTWAWIWSNDSDGTLGDKRGSWHLKTGNAESFWNQYIWLTLRNPTNNLRRVPGVRCPVNRSVIGYSGDYFVDDRPGGEGCQLVWARKGIMLWVGLYYVKFTGDGKAVRIRLGWKVKPSHAKLSQTDPIKYVGATVSIAPFKTLKKK